ncbi:MAG TPA: ADP-glyceromanno-heptose 6-epimerase [Chitinophagaceae bacterium]|nr:ADP-glyceromanno-heptose 6-epimerase [Chitinophagaceae bacterium]
MDKNSNIVVTGAAGFIGSCLVSYLNESGYQHLFLVDDFSAHRKDANLAGKKFLQKIERETFFDWLEKERPPIDFIYHIGARTDTTEFDYSVHEHLNVKYSQKIWKYCAQYAVPLVYASSAATYGAGEKGYRDDESLIDSLQPLNPYGVSKNEFDKWVLHEVKRGAGIPPAWAGLKFFNVYGPNEYHKARMASVIFHSYQQIQKDGFVNLFKSHREGYKDGEQLRDFIYVKDVISICYWFLQQWQKNKNFASGIYNVGTGTARTFNDLVNATFAGLDRKAQIKYIDMPEDIRNTYQYYTRAEMQKIRQAGYSKEMYSLEDGVDDYVRNYLSRNRYY